MAKLCEHPRAGGFLRPSSRRYCLLFGYFKGEKTNQSKNNQTTPPPPRSFSVSTAPQFAFLLIWGNGIHHHPQNSITVTKKGAGLILLYRRENLALAQLIKKEGPALRIFAQEAIYSRDSQNPARNIPLSMDLAEKPPGSGSWGTTGSPASQ